MTFILSYHSTDSRFSFQRPNRPYFKYYAPTKSTSAILGEVVRNLDAISRANGSRLFILGKCRDIGEDSTATIVNDRVFAD